MTTMARGWHTVGFTIKDFPYPPCVLAVLREPAMSLAAWWLLSRAIVS